MATATQTLFPVFRKHGVPLGETAQGMALVEEIALASPRMQGISLGPADLAADPVLYGECLSGALYWGDFQSIAKAAGFTDPRTVNHRRLGYHGASQVRSQGSHLTPRQSSDLRQIS